MKEVKIQVVESLEKRCSEQNEEPDEQHIGSIVRYDSGELSGDHVPCDGPQPALGVSREMACFHRFMFCLSPSYKDNRSLNQA